MVADGFVGQDVAQIMMQTGMEAFSNPEVINNSIKYLNKNKLFKNEFLNDFKLVNLWPLTATKSLGVLSKMLLPNPKMSLSIRFSPTLSLRSFSFAFYIWICDPF